MLALLYGGQGTLSDKIFDRRSACRGTGLRRRNRLYLQKLELGAGKRNFRPYRITQLAQAKVDQPAIARQPLLMTLPSPWPGACAIPASQASLRR
ncbi:hypothetical protein [Bradyrhizobium sp. Cp5.3]|uniref:hypothetical protein n=1 Tax=Bradyrhizobium sp. Cp5.3 TaxID=443598 RepID=UPI0012EBC23D